MNIKAIHHFLPVIFSIHLSYMRASVNPPTSLSVECERRCHQPASLSGTNRTPLTSLRSSAIQPSSTPNLVAASLQARRLAYYLLKGTELRRERPPQGATGRHRLPQDVRLYAFYTLSNPINPPKSNRNLPATT